MRAISRSREGAWIEIAEAVEKCAGEIVAPVRERGLKCARKIMELKRQRVAPVRERGLKLYAVCSLLLRAASLP